jgi:DNA repair protein RadC
METKKEKVEVNSAKQAVEILRGMLLSEFKEHFLVHLLNARNEIIVSEIVSVGTLNASLVHPRETFRTAIVNHTNSIIIAHNHPSGEIEPSEDDRKVTERLVKAGEILGIEVLDHVIFTKEAFYSFKEKNLI